MFRRFLDPKHGKDPHVGDRKKANCKKTTTNYRLKSRATQANGRDIDSAFELMCEDPKTTFDTYIQTVARRKQQKYKKIFLGGNMIKTSNETLNKEVDYEFGPKTLYKNTRQCCA